MLFIAKSTQLHLTFDNYAQDCNYAKFLSPLSHREKRIFSESNAFE